MSMGIFEKKFGVSPGTLETISDVNTYVENKIGKELLPSINHGNGFVLPQGNVFSINNGNINDLVDCAIKGQGWLRAMISKS